MCNLYAITKSPDAIRNLFKALRDTTGNLLPLPAIFPDPSHPWCGPDGTGSASSP
jgi:hypothetical protein